MLSCSGFGKLVKFMDSCISSDIHYSRWQPVQGRKSTVLVHVKIFNYKLSLRTLEVNGERYPQEFLPASDVKGFEGQHSYRKKPRKKFLVNVGKESYIIVQIQLKWFNLA